MKALGLQKAKKSLWVVTSNDNNDRAYIEFF